MPYELFIFSVKGTEATSMAHYTNASFSFTYGDWLEWSGFSLALASNSTYAYGFGRSASGTGWAALNTSPGTTDLYPGGQICFIPTSGGALTLGNTGLSDAVFDIGLSADRSRPQPIAVCQCHRGLTLPDGRGWERRSHSAKPPAARRRCITSGRRTAELER